MKLYRGDLPGGQLLLTIHDDESMEVAFRADQWETWDPAIRLTAVTA